MNPIGWIEVPVADMQRAMRFYNAVFEWDLKENILGPLSMAWFPASQNVPGSGGSLVKNENYRPSSDGALVYFSCKDVAVQIERVEKAGGQVLKAKTQISPQMGFMALALDSEGNRIAFHSYQ
jgi:predicted enzyme related to lactoylglutathione lyase